MNAALPQEMQQHTYAIMDEVEGSHWWFVGRRAILESFLKGIAKRFETRLQAAGAEQGPAKAGTQNSYTWAVVIASPVNGECSPP